MAITSLFPSLPPSGRPWESAHKQPATRPALEAVSEVFQMSKEITFRIYFKMTVSPPRPQNSFFICSSIKSQTNWAAHAPLPPPGWYLSYSWEIDAEAASAPNISRSHQDRGLSMLHMVRLDVSQHPMLVIIVHHTALSLPPSLLPWSLPISHWFSLSFIVFPFPKCLIRIRYYAAFQTIFFHLMTYIYIFQGTFFLKTENNIPFSGLQHFNYSFTNSGTFRLLLNTWSCTELK